MRRFYFVHEHKGGGEGRGNIVIDGYMILNVAEPFHDIDVSIPLFSKKSETVPVRIRGF